MISLVAFLGMKQYYYLQEVLHRETSYSLLNYHWKYILYNRRDPRCSIEVNEKGYLGDRYRSIYWATIPHQTANRLGSPHLYDGSPARRPLIKNQD
jgi:hypothetical protein